MQSEVLHNLTDVHIDIQIFTPSCNLELLSALSDLINISQKQDDNKGLSVHLSGNLIHKLQSFSPAYPIQSYIQQGIYALYYQPGNSRK